MNRITVMMADLRKRLLKTAFCVLGANNILNRKKRVMIILPVNILPRIIWAKIVGSIFHFSSFRDDFYKCYHVKIKWTS